MSTKDQIGEFTSVVNTNQPFNSTKGEQGISLPPFILLKELFVKIMDIPGLSNSSLC